MMASLLLLLVLVFPGTCWEVSDYWEKLTPCDSQWVQDTGYLDLTLNCNAPDQASIQPTNDTRALRLSPSTSCLTAFPLNLCDFSGIISISMHNNKISEIPSLACLSKLAYLDLSYNRITRLRAQTFAGLENLRMLFLNHNNIRTIDVGVFNPSLVNLMLVNLDYNELTAWEAWPMLLEHQFCYFSVANNDISTFTNKENWTLNDNVFDAYGLVDLSNNTLTKWIVFYLKQYGIDDITDLSKLIQWGFDFRGNPWHCDCHFYEFLKLTKGGDFVHVFFGEQFIVRCASPAELAGRLIYNLSLSELVCNVSQACPEGCFCQDQPHQARMLVRCSGAGLQALPASLPPGPLHLHLQHNRIAQLRPAAYLARVVELHLSHNGLVSLSPEAAALLRGVRVLDVAHNRLRYLPRQLQGLPPGALRLEENPLQCRCNSSWLGQWLRNVRAAHGPTLLNQSSPSLLQLTCQLQDGRTVPAIQETVRSLGCQEPRRPLVLDVLLGSGLVLLVLLLVLALLFRYELLVLLHRHRASWRRPGQDGPDLAYDWFLSVESEDEADRLWAGQELRPMLENVRDVRLYIPFIHHDFGGVAADQTMAAIQHSRGAIVLLSSSYASSRPRSFEFTHLYKVMASRGQGPIRVIKHPGVKASSVVNGYLRAMVRLKMYLDFEDEALVSKVMESRASP